MQFAIPIFGDIFFTIINRMVNCVNVMSDFVIQNFGDFAVTNKRRSQDPRWQPLHHVVY
jgi:hypothetical protein